MTQAMTSIDPIVEVEQNFKQRLSLRHLRGGIWRRFFLTAIIIGLLALIAIFFNVNNSAFGLVVMRYTVDPATLLPPGVENLEDLSGPELALILSENLRPGPLRVIVRDNLSQVPRDEFTRRPLHEVLAGRVFPGNLRNLTINELTPEEITLILTLNMTQEQLYDAVIVNVVQPRVVRSWSLFDSLFRREAVEAEAARLHPDLDLVFRSWVSWDFITSPISSVPTTAGLRTALLGSMWIMLITILFAFPLGVGAAIYLQEYATDSRLNRIIETNIRNLAGVPSIIYGMLGLAVFVRALGYFTSGQFVGVTDTNSRTVLSAGLTMGLLILPVIIINAQEALRAVPPSIREASYGLGATKWQTTWRTVLPAAVPGILTGVILSMSRAIGETAPLIVVGASTFIGIDPSGPFSKFTVIPIQIYQWTGRPEAEFKNLAAAAIIVLVTLLLLLNGTAIFLRQRYRKRLQL